VLCSNEAADGCQRPTRAQPRSAPTLPSPASGGGGRRGPQNCWQSLRCSFGLS
jgi:hypothetical protein